MKRIAFFIISLIISAGMLAQDDMDADKALRKADRELGRYQLDPSNNSDKLGEALDYIQIAYESDNQEVKKDPEFWNVRGKIYNALASRDIKMQMTSPDYQPKHPDAAYMAYESFKKNLSLAEKSYQKEDALKGVFETASHLSNLGNARINAGQYAKAFEPLNVVLQINEILKKNNYERKLFQKQADFLNQKYVTAVCAMQSGANDRAKELFEDLYELEYDNPRVYSNYFNMLIEEDEDKAMKVLSKGQEMYPENTEMLFAEINYYIKEQKYEVLEEKLQEAVQRDPDNPSVYLALGNVYNNLFQRAYGKDSIEQANNYFDEAKQYFEKTLELAPDNFDAMYSIGQLYFNKAAELSQRMNELPLDKEEEYNRLDKEVKQLFDKALPYFKKAEKLNPSDRSTIIALKEIFARRNNFELSKEFKDRLEKIKAGGQIEQSYFEANPNAGMSSEKDTMKKDTMQ